jgi:putative membrane protein
MGFGFVVARFGLFLGMIHPGASSGHPISLFVGVSLVVLGVATIAMSAVQHKRFVATLRPADLPAHAALGFPLFIAWALVVLGLVLAGYLII